MQKFHLLRDLVLGLEDDFEKFFVKGNKAAGTRIRKGMPDPQKDGPTQFTAKLNGTVRALEMSAARTQYLRRNGFPEISGHGAEARNESDMELRGPACGRWRRGCCE